MIVISFFRPVVGILQRLAVWLTADVIVGIVCACLILYYLFPRLSAADYTAAVTLNARPLLSYYTTLEKTADLPVFGDLHESAAVQQADLAKAETATQDALYGLSELEQRCYQLPYFTRFYFSEDYRQARVLQQHCTTLIEQSLHALHNYDLLVSYLSKQSALQHEFTAIVRRFNSTGDLNDYAGRGFELRRDADRLREMASQTKSFAVPGEIRPLRAALAETYAQAADGFSKLADGIDIAVDSEIYSSANAIEEATVKNEKEDAAACSRLLDKSQTLQNIRNISEKLELLR